MKKTTNLTFLFLTILLFFSLYVYTETTIINQNGYFNYHTSNLLEYIFFWSLTLFIFSLFTFKLDIYKYKIWLMTSIPTSFASIIIAYMVGDGNGTIIDINGELTT